MGKLVRWRFGGPRPTGQRLPSLDSLDEERGMCLSSSEFLMYLMSRVRHSEASRFLTLEYIGQVGEHEFRMSLNGPDGDFRVEVGPHTSRICLMGERIWFISESHREGRAYQNIADDVVYGGPIDGRTHAEVIGLFLEVLGILAGATGLFHARAQEGRCDLDSGTFAIGQHAQFQIHSSAQEGQCDLDSGTRHYDVYVRNAHTGPYRRTLANISFHVNCDADWGADGAEGGAEPASAAPSPEGGTPRSGPGRYCPVGDGPTGLMGRDMDPTRADVEWFMRRLGRSDVSRLLSLDLQEDSGGGFCLCLDGPGDDFYVGFDSHLFDVCNAWERIWFTSESHRPSPDSQDSWGEIVYDGPVEGEDRVELFDLAYETVRVLAGATGAFHDEIRTKEDGAAMCLGTYPLDGPLLVSRVGVAEPRLEAVVRPRLREQPRLGRLPEEHPTGLGRVVEHHHARHPADELEDPCETLAEAPRLLAPRRHAAPRPRLRGAGASISGPGLLPATVATKLPQASCMIPGAQPGSR
ncbi:MAG: hypothetical protein ACFNLW_09405 [Olsenella sp.]